MKELDNFVENLRKRRKHLGLSQLKFAQLLDVSTTAINRWEHGAYLPTLYSAVLAAKALGCTLDEMCGMDKGK